MGVGASLVVCQSSNGGLNTCCVILVSQLYVQMLVVGEDNGSDAHLAGNGGISGG